MEPLTSVPSQVTRDKAEVIERRIAVVRLLMVVTGWVLFPLLFDGRPEAIPWLGYSLLMSGAVYGLLAWQLPSVRQVMDRGPPLVTTTADMAFTMLWLTATGGVESPFVIVMYLAVVSVAIRFSTWETWLGALLYATGYLVLVAALGQLEDHVQDVVVRLVYTGIAAMTGVVVVTSIRDETEARSEAQRLVIAERLKEQLYMSDRMASLGRLAGGVAHEINNPLAFVVSNLEQLAEQLGETADPELEAMIEETQAGAERIRSIVRELSDFSRPDDLERANTPVNVRDVLRLAISMAFVQTRHRAAVVEDLGETAPVLADATRLGQVFLNLVVNAAQAIEPGQADDNEIRVSLRAGDGRTVIVEVSDTGAGVDPAVRDRLFDPYVTTKPRGTGTGLGLAISHRIITGLGGTIDVGARPGGGTVVRVVLPATEVEDAVDVAVAGERTPGRRLRVLVVDDEALLCRSLERMLRGAHDVVACTRAADALLALEEDPGFDVILCDVMMPSMTGPELFTRMAALRPALARHVVFMTGGVFDAETQRRLDELGAPRLTKPFSRAQVLTVVEAVAQATTGASTASSSASSELDGASSTRR